MADAKEELIEYTYSKTLCQQRPECCDPRTIKMVLWDADDTMWEIRPYSIASNITGKLVKIDDDTIEVEETFAPPKHPYETETPPKKPPERKEKKRPYMQTAAQERLEEWWQKQLGDVSPDEEIRHIEEELIRSVKEPLPVIKPKKGEEVLLERITGWNSHQQPQVDTLLKRYGKNTCTVFNVHSSGALDIDCRGDIWMLTKDGQLMGEGAQEAANRLSQPLPPLEPQVSSPAPSPEPPKPKKGTGYQPQKITITLLPTFRETVKKLKEKGISNAVISLNTPGSVKRIVEAFGMGSDFIEVKDTWENKGKVFDDITRNHKICPCNAMFVDNTLSHVSDVAKKCGLSVQIGKGKDVEKPIEILRYIK